MTWDVQWASHNEKLHVSLTSFNKLAVYWLGKHFYFIFQCGFVQLLRNAKVLQLKSSFTCRSRHRAGSCDCHNNCRCWLDIRGDHKICRNTGRIHSHDLPMIKKFLEHVVSVSMRHDKWSVHIYGIEVKNLKLFRIVGVCICLTFKAIRGRSFRYHVMGYLQMLYHLTFFHQKSIENNSEQRLWSKL